MRTLIDRLRCHVGAPRWTRVEMFHKGHLGECAPRLITVCASCRTQRGDHL